MKYFSPFFLLLLFTISLSTHAYGQSSPCKSEVVEGRASLSIPQDASQKFASPLPTGYPVFTDTGNPQADQARYAEAKKAWIANNPEKYRLMNHQGLNPHYQEELRIRNQAKNNQ